MCVRACIFFRPNVYLIIEVFTLQTINRLINLIEDVHLKLKARVLRARLAGLTCDFSFALYSPYILPVNIVYLLT